MSEQYYLYSKLTPWLEGAAQRLCAVLAVGMGHAPAPAPLVLPLRPWLCHRVCCLSTGWQDWFSVCLNCSGFPLRASPVVSVQVSLAGAPAGLDTAQEPCRTWLFSSEAPPAPSQRLLPTLTVLLARHLPSAAVTKPAVFTRAKSSTGSL